MTLPRINDDVARMTDEGLHNVTDPTPDQAGELPSGAKLATATLAFAAAVCIVLGWLVVDRVWHSTVTPYNSEERP